MAEQRYSIDEIARRGDEIYDRNIRAEVESAHDGEIVAIDIDTGFYAAGRYLFVRRRTSIREESRCGDLVRPRGPARRYSHRFLEECSSEMITGKVNKRREAIINIEVHGTDSRQATTPRYLDAVIDTGFDGFLILPASSIAALGLRQLGSKTAELGDGSICRLPVYNVRVMWNGVMRDGEVSAAEIEPLVGMELMTDCEVRIQVAEGGAVTIEAMP